MLNFVARMRTGVSIAYCRKSFTSYIQPYNNSYSKVVTHLVTVKVRRCLTSVFVREAGFQCDMAVSPLQQRHIQAYSTFCSQAITGMARRYLTRWSTRTGVQYHMAVRHKHHSHIRDYNTHLVSARRKVDSVDSRTRTTVSVLYGFKTLTFAHPRQHPI